MLINMKNTIPAKAIFIASVEWGFSPVSSREDTFYIFLDPNKRTWQLWQTWYDDNYCKDEIEISNTLSTDVTKDVKIAAITMISNYWQSEINMGLSYAPEFIMDTGLLNIDEVNEICNQLWNDHE